MSRLLIIITLLLLWFSGVSQTKDNIGEGINSKYRDINPIISPDGSTMYFTRIDHPENNFGSIDSEDCWLSEYNKENDEWEKAEKLPAVFNTQQRNCILSVTPDGNVFLIRGAYENGKFLGRGLSLIYREKNGYSLPEKLDIKYYEKLDKGIYSGGFLANDGQTLILYLSPKKNDENCDLYLSRLKDNGTWSKPRSISPQINTKEWDEISPFLAADGKTLYFSSNRPGGSGLHDIYLSRRLDETWFNWSEPINLGLEVNTDKWEAYYSISASGDYAYVTSTENSFGLEDINRIKLTDEIVPSPVVIVFGRVTDGTTKEYLSAEIVYSLFPEGVIEGVARTNPTDGSYKIVLPIGSKYSFNAKANGYFPVSDNIDLTKVYEYREIEKDLLLMQIEVGQTIRLNNIFFDFNKSSLRSESFPELKRVIKLMDENNKMEIEISGHTDDVGSDSFNLNLSKERALAVERYLVSNGIKETRIVAKGYGKSKPVANNNTEKGKQLNRRVEFTILKK